MSSLSFHDILHNYWGYDDFRGIQLDIISSIASGHDTLGLMPTGGGKSITFQVPALAMQGICIVVTPLIALMKDQVDKLKKRGIKSAAIYSGMSHDDIVRTLDNCILGNYKFIYVSPERLASQYFQTKLRHMKVSFVAVDEAHCISQWGYDFRPSYLAVARIRPFTGNAPILALTATATRRVVQDIMAQLNFAEPRVFSMSFHRPNLAYIVRFAEDKKRELLHIINRVEGSVIVYTRNRAATSEIAEFLESKGISAFNYHAGLTNLDKDVRQVAWQENKVRAMVATNAFGMGIDKADVRLVIHMDMPDSIEAYFQEAGRAGRDGRKAYAVLLHNDTDISKIKLRIPNTFPPKDYIANVYDDLGCFFQLAEGDGYNVNYEFPIEKFCTKFHYFPVQLVSALQILTRAGYIDYREEEESHSRLMFTVGRDELYRIREITGDLEKIINCIFRSHTGLFSDYVAIEENDIASLTGFSVNTVYQQLIRLTRMGIAHYIPRKSIPHIRFTTRRVGKKDFALSRAVYEERKALYEERVYAMLDYATKDDTCRNRYLLAYFDDFSAADCGQCDVCIARKGEREADGRPIYEQLAARLLEKMSDGKAYAPYELSREGYSPHEMRLALEYLTKEELIKEYRGKYSKAQGREQTAGMRLKNN